MSAPRLNKMPICSAKTRGEVEITEPLSSSEWYVRIPMDLDRDILGASNTRLSLGNAIFLPVLYSQWIYVRLQGQRPRGRCCLAARSPSVGTRIRHRDPQVLEPLL